MLSGDPWVTGTPLVSLSGWVASVGLWGKLRGIRRQAAFLSAPSALRHRLTWRPLTRACQPVGVGDTGSVLLSGAGMHAHGQSRGGSICSWKCARGRGVRGDVNSGAGAGQIGQGWGQWSRRRLGGCSKHLHGHLHGVGGPGRSPRPRDPLGHLSSCPVPAPTLRLLLLRALQDRDVLSTGAVSHPHARSSEPRTSCLRPSVGGCLVFIAGR